MVAPTGIQSNVIYTRQPCPACDTHHSGEDYQAAMTITERCVANTCYEWRVVDSFVGYLRMAVFELHHNSRTLARFDRETRFGARHKI
jgi:hypothetical protein